MMNKSWAPAFRRLIFEKIDEHRYAELYSTVESRPNFPVNIWVGLEIIKGMFDLTDQELLEQFHFNLPTTYAVGLEDLGEVTLCERTVYYNRERLLEYETKTGRNLLKEESDAITDDALNQLPIDSKTQRMDSSFVGSFIKQISRLELTVKVLQNFYHDLPETEQTCWASQLGKYVEEEAKHITYHLKRAEVEEHLQEVGALLFELHQAYAGNEEISSLKSYQHIGRILLEQFNIIEDSGQTIIEVKPGEEISASSLDGILTEQLPDIVRFSREQCGGCPYVVGCPVHCRRRFYSLLFSDRQVLLAQRRQQLREAKGSWAQKGAK